MELIKSQLTFSEVASTVRDIADSCFVMDDDGNDIDYSTVAKSASIQVAFLENYTDFVFAEPENKDDETESSEVFNKNYEKYMSIRIEDFDTYRDKDGYVFNKFQWDSLLKSADELIEYRKQKLLDSQSKQSEMYSSITNLLSTLNSKAGQLDMKKLEKQLKKLNASEIMKAYQKSGIGDGVRDNAIKDLRNQISARNVMTDKSGE